MTEAYDRLQEGAQTGIARSRLSFDERAEVRVIQVSGTSGLTQSNNPGKFTDIIYLEGDERSAAELFAEENGNLIEEVDLSKRNVLQTSVSRDLYDMILDATGRRNITKFPTVVSEIRENGGQWLISRERYDTQVDRRYTTSESSAHVPPATSLREIYDKYGQTISEQDLRETPIEGDVRQVLDYYRVAPDFDCQPVSTADKQLAVEKR